MSNTSITGDDYGFFWHSQGGDRLYNPTSFELWIKKFFTVGVFQGDLFTTATSGMNISVSGGYANVDGKVKFFPSENILTVPAAGANTVRIDTVVIERNDGDRNIFLKVVEGTPTSSNPSPTPPVRSDGVYQLVIAEVYVGAAVSEITQANITDKRLDDTVCGYVTGTVEEISWSQIIAQWNAYVEEFKSEREDDFDAWVAESEADYTDWFNNVRQQQIQDKENWDDWYSDLQEDLHNLPSDTAEYLQSEIFDIKQAGTTGSIIHISTTESTLESKNVTVTNGTITKTGTFDENLECIISNFTGTGQTTITATDGVDTSIRRLNIPYFGEYNASLTFFSATVNIVGINDMADLTVTITDSNGNVVNTVTLDSEGEGTFTVYDADTYTLSYVYNEESYTKNVIINTSGSYTVKLVVEISVTMYGAVGAVIKFTDAGGTQIKTLGNDGTLSDVSIIVDLDNPTITFTDTTVAKNPNDLSENYSKSITLTEQTTEVYVMPDNALYWYGVNNANLQGYAYARDNAAKMPTVVSNTNSIRATSTPGYDTTRGVLGTLNYYDFSNFDSIKCITNKALLKGFSGLNLNTAIDLLSTQQFASRYTSTAYKRILVASTGTTQTITTPILNSCDISSINDSEQIGIEILTSDVGDNYIEINALWLE